MTAEAVEFTDEQKGRRGMEGGAEGEARGLGWAREGL